MPIPQLGAEGSDNGLLMYIDTTEEKVKKIKSFTNPARTRGGPALYCHRGRIYTMALWLVISDCRRLNEIRLFDQFSIESLVRVYVKLFSYLEVSSESMSS